MTKHLTVAALVALGLAAVTPVRALEKLTVQVSPTVGIAPAYVRIRAMVEHDKDNRAIEIVADSDGFYRRSVVQLDGETAPKVNELLLKDVPGGHYDITVTLFDQNGSRAVAHRTVEIVAAGDRN